MKKFFLMLFVVAFSLNFVQCTKHSHNDGEPIELNAGEKWKVNEEMKPFVITSEEMLQDYDGDYALLAQNLKDQNAKLIKSCTMEGKSHDELHKWLHPHMEIVKELENAPDAAQADKVVKKLEGSFQTYHTYFE
ncbi:MAG: hypothetical protein Q4G27_04870 [Flavobacteriaceae bacterium]|nr:hypothetical protein [Flavobacteriaceae bacterium]